MASITRTFTWTTTLITLLIGFGAALAGPWLMLAFGRAFVQTAPLLWIIVAAQLFNAACGPVGMILTMSGNARAALFGQVAGLAANIIIGLVLIPSYGIWAATCAMAVGIVVWNISMLVSLKRRLAIPTSLPEFRK